MKESKGLNLRDLPKALVLFALVYEAVASTADPREPYYLKLLGAMSLLILALIILWTVRKGPAIQDPKEEARKAEQSQAHRSTRN
jgi:hypothetical protein